MQSRMEVTILTVGGTIVYKKNVSDIDVLMYEFYDEIENYEGLKIPHSIRDRMGTWDLFYDHFLVFSNKVLKKNERLKDYVKLDKEIVLTLVILPLSDF